VNLLLLSVHLLQSVEEIFMKMKVEKIVSVKTSKESPLPNLSLTIAPQFLQQQKEQIWFD
jgi:hypothetical protein